MRLRTRILLGYGYLIALVLLAAGSAVIGFFDLGGGIEEIRKDDIRSVRETTTLIEALERQDSATLTGLLQGDRNAEQLSEGKKQFRTAFEALREHAESDEKRSLLEELDGHYREYRQARAALLDAPSDRPLPAYRERVSPKFRTVKEDLIELLDLNHEAITEADRAAQSRALGYGSWVGFLVVVALFSFVFLTRKLRLNFLDRLSQIREVADAVESGDRVRRVSIERDDELGAVARELNRALDRYQQMETRLDGVERELKQLVLGLLDQIDRPLTLYGADGQKVATTLSREAAQGLPTEGMSEIVERGNELVREGEAARERLELAEHDLEVELAVVETPAGRRVGWLVEFLSLPTDRSE